MGVETQRLYSDVVKVVNRTTEQIEWQYDSELYVLKPSGSKMVPRFIAMHGINAHPVSRDPSSGQVDVSMIGIDDEKGNYPITPLDIDVTEVREGNKLGNDPVFVDGKSIKKKTVNLTPYKESFAGNNT